MNMEKSSSIYLQFGYFNILWEFLLETEDIVLAIWYIYLYKITHGCSSIVTAIQKRLIQCSLFSLARTQHHSLFLAYSHYDGRLLFVSDLWMEYDFIVYGSVIEICCWWFSLDNEWHPMVRLLWSWLRVRLSNTHKYLLRGICIGICCFSALALPMQNLHCLRF